jgi:hypothetical protein
MRHWILLAAVLVLVGLDARYSGAQVAKKRPNNVVGTIWEFQASASSRLKCRIGRFIRIGDPAWHKEVCHAEAVCRATDGSGTP